MNSTNTTKQPRTYRTSDGEVWDFHSNAVARQRYLNLKALLQRADEQGLLLISKAAAVQAITVVLR